ncbi:MAG: zinc transporter ZupT [Deltaproteobacteria bacterium]|jgi:ZIP family zinc transporter|nr:zinc transporter ZupT [Deltaproteobacteria bacterium]
MTVYYLAFGLTLFAGLATGIGSAFAFFSKKTNPIFLSQALGFSAGVMVYVSMIELFPESKTLLSKSYGEKTGYLLATISFFMGMAIIALIDKFVPNFENPHELKDVSEMDELTEEKKEALRKSKDLMRMGLVSAIAIAIHNFPEGIATFAATIEDPAIGFSIAIAIAIHNIPEGIAVSVPIFYATGNRKKAFCYSFLSGLAEPLGAVLGFFLLYSIFDASVIGFIFGGIAGIMVFISFDELLPAAEKYGEHHWAILGVIAGMAVMAASLLLLQ